MLHPNRSVPALGPPPADDAPPPPLPQHGAFDPTMVLDRFGAMHLQEPPLAPGYDPIPRAGTSMSVRSALSASTPYPPPRASSMGYRPGSTDAGSITAQVIDEEGGGLAYDTPEAPVHDDGASVYSHAQYYQPPNGYGSPQQQWQQQPQPGYDPYQYGYGQQQQSYPQADGSMQPQQGGYAPSMASPYSTQSPYAQSVRSFQSSQSAPALPHGGRPAPPGGGGDDEEFAPRRPSLQREPTVAGVPSMRNAHVKAVDLSAPPYTKQYIDEYRQRIKADPDPEAHFAYVKYLVDAAKRVGTDAKDQRAVKKYREALLAEALKVLRRLATQGTPYDEAQFFLANCYGTGLLGLQVDHERAYHLYLQAAKQNNAAAAYRVAVCNEIGAGTRKEPARAAAFYRKAASLGDTAAMYKLGMVLLDGALGEARNPRDAVGWLKRAAEQADDANPHALHELGLLHDDPAGALVPYDPVYAKRLFTQAGQLGYTHAQFRLGQMYERGSPATPQDARRSIAWYTKAAEKGHAEAELALSGWYLTGVDGVLKQSDSEAYLWARRAANKGLSKAEYAVGYYAEIGIGIKQDIEFAKRWYMRAAGACASGSLARARAESPRSAGQQARDEPADGDQARRRKGCKGCAPNTPAGPGRLRHLVRRADCVFSCARLLRSLFLRHGFGRESAHVTAALLGSWLRRRTRSPSPCILPTVSTRLYEPGLPCRMDLVMLGRR
jgi:TPR repeat protein